MADSAKADFPEWLYGFHSRFGYFHGPYRLTEPPQQLKISLAGSKICGWPLPSGKQCGARMRSDLRRHLREIHHLNVQAGNKPTTAEREMAGATMWYYVISGAFQKTSFENLNDQEKADQANEWLSQSIPCGVTKQIRHRVNAASDQATTLSGGPVNAHQLSEITQTSNPAARAIHSLTWISAMDYLGIVTPEYFQDFTIPQSALGNHSIASLCPFFHHHNFHV